MKNLFFLMLMAGLACSCGNNNQKEGTNTDSTVNNQTNVENVNGNVPDTTNSVNLNNPMPVDSSNLKDSLRR